MISGRAPPDHNAKGPETRSGPTICSRIMPRGVKSRLRHHCFSPADIPGGESARASWISILKSLGSGQGDTFIFIHSAAMAVFHVYIAHFAVGGGLFLVLTERMGYRRNSPGILEYTRRHTKFFLLDSAVKLFLPTMRYT